MTRRRLCDQNPLGIENTIAHRWELKKQKRKLRECRGRKYGFFASESKKRQNNEPETSQQVGTLPDNETCITSESKKRQHKETRSKEKLDEHPLTVSGFQLETSQQVSVLPVNQTIITYQIKKRQRDEPKQIEESDNCPSTASGFQLETLQQQVNETINCLQSDDFSSTSMEVTSDPQPSKSTPPREMTDHMYSLLPHKIPENYPSGLEQYKPTEMDERWVEVGVSFIEALLYRKNPSKCNNCKTETHNCYIVCNTCKGYFCPECDLTAHTSNPFHQRECWIGQEIYQMQSSQFVEQSTGSIIQRAVAIPCFLPENCKRCQDSGELLIVPGSREIVVFNREGRFHLNVTKFHCVKCDSQSEATVHDYIKSGFWPSSQKQPKELFCQKLFDLWHHVRRKTPETTEAKFLEALQQFSNGIEGYEPTDPQSFSTAYEKYENCKSVVQAKILNEEEDNAWQMVTVLEAADPSAVVVFPVANSETQNKVKAKRRSRSVLVEERQGNFAISFDKRMRFRRLRKLKTLLEDLLSTGLQTYVIYGGLNPKGGYTVGGMTYGPIPEDIVATTKGKEFKEQFEGLFRAYKEEQSRQASGLLEVENMSFTLGAAGPLVCYFGGNEKQDDDKTKKQNKSKIPKGKEQKNLAFSFDKRLRYRRLKRAKEMLEDLLSTGLQIYIIFGGFDGRGGHLLEGMAYGPVPREILVSTLGEEFKNGFEDEIRAYAGRHSHEDCGLGAKEANLPDEGDDEAIQPPTKTIKLY